MPRRAPLQATCLPSDQTLEGLLALSGFAPLSPPSTQNPSPASAVPEPACSLVPRFVEQRDGLDYCILCQQWSDQNHLRSKKHMRRAADPEWYMWGDGADEEVRNRQGYMSKHEHDDRVDSMIRHEESQLSEQSPGLRSTSIRAVQKVLEAARAGNALNAMKTCSWCTEPASDMILPGTKAKYCKECWKWWQSGHDGGILKNERFLTMSPRAHSPGSTPPQRAPRASMSSAASTSSSCGAPSLSMASSLDMLSANHAHLAQAPRQSQLALDMSDFLRAELGPEIQQFSF